MSATAVIALVTSIALITLTDKLGRRMVVVIASIACTLTMLIVGILGFVPKTDALRNFLIFDACVWSFFNVARKSIFTRNRGSSSSSSSSSKLVPHPDTGQSGLTPSNSRQSWMGLRRRGRIAATARANRWYRRRNFCDLRADLQHLHSHHV